MKLSHNIVAPKDAPLCNAWLSMLHGLGIEAERHGDSKPWRNALHYVPYLFGEGKTINPSNDHHMQKSLEGKTFVIAGGSSGIGLQMVELLCSHGANIHVFSRSIGELKANERLTHHAIDFESDAMDSVALPEELHGAAYCPGTINLRSFRSLKLEHFRHDFEVNLLGAVKFLKKCMSGLQKGGESHPSSVVLFSTIAVGMGLPMHASIAAAKGAVEGLTRSLAAEWAPKIRVNCLAPALTDTPLSASLLSTSEKRIAMDSKYPLGRIGQPIDIASIACFLLSRESSWITGQVIGIDGGMSSLRV